MSDHIRLAIEEIQGQISERLKEIAGLKQAVNSLCAVLKVDPLYQDIDQESSGVVSPKRADAYFGKPLSTAGREYLEFRKQACSSEDILAGLVQGGFDFDAIGWKGEHRLRSLAASLSKNTAIFRRLPNGMFGLRAWYQDAPVVKRKGKSKADGEADTSASTSEQQPLPEAETQEPPAPVYLDDAEVTETGSPDAPDEPVSEA